MNGGLVQGEISPSNQQKISSPKSKRFWFVLIAFLAVILLIGGFVVWTSYLSPEAKSERETRLNYEKATKALSDFETAMKNDTYGGKTPQETLDMFIDALKKGDIELASKYFVRNGAGQIDSKWMEGLRNLKTENKLESVINKLLAVKLTFQDDNGALFKYYNSNGEVDVLVDMNLNKYSNVWKIVSM